MSERRIISLDDASVPLVIEWARPHAFVESAQEDIAAAESILSTEERARASRFKFREDYLSYVTAHALLRQRLSEFDGTAAPEDWMFSVTPTGRPIVAAEMNRPGVHFSLSHSRELVTCIVSSHGFCGVDVERIGRVSDPLELAVSVFSDTEIGDLKTMEGRERDEYFTSLWCLKEAFLKAEGVGLAAPLDNFHFRLTLGREAPSVFFPPPGKDAAGWRFRLIRPCETHLIAVAVDLRS